jgi:uncharacterized membrane protein YfcA
MQMQLFLCLIILAFLAEYVNAGVGMMYGTFLTPLLVSFGFNPLAIIPAVLLSQGLGGIPASIFHHRLKNAHFSLSNSKSPIKNEDRGQNKKSIFSHDLLVALAISLAGICSTLCAVYLAVSVPSWAVSIYIGLLAIIMGIILLVGIKIKFSWKKIIALGIVGSFNKGFSGGGFGPIISSGQVAVGRKTKEAVAVTMFSEIPICIAGFLMYWFLNGINQWNIVSALSIGALLGAPLGALSTRFMREHDLRPIMGALAVLLGIWAITKILFT